MNIQRFFNTEQANFFLFGPRGTGKTTLMHLLFPDAVFIELLFPNTRRKFLANPELLVELVHAEPPGKVIILDEIQRAPELLSLIHLLIEEKKGWQFILTGSSARKLKQKGVDLLGGRALKKVLHPFMAAELKTLFNLNDALQFGLLPLRFAFNQPLATLDSYISLYLDEEVRAEGIVRNIEPFAKFLEVISFSHGSILNISNIARECNVKRNTVNSWLQVLDDLLLIYQLPVFNRRAKRESISHSKLYLFDTGIFQALRPRSVIDSAQEIDGIALEGLVAQHLRAWVDYSKTKHQLFFWRTRSNVEVDFIIYGELGFWAIEVKNSHNINPKDLNGLNNFHQDYPEATPILLYRGKDKLLKNNILCLPVDIFLQNLYPDQTLYR